MLSQNHPEYVQFPDPKLANKQGFIGHGANLAVNTLVSAYQQGIFPWFSDNEPILWWSPNPRMLLPTSDIHISRSLRKVIQSKHFTITYGKAFEEVIEQCSRPRPTKNREKITSISSIDGSQTWITQDMKQAYINLHHAGYAQSIECWQGDQLVGGLYGVTIAGMYFGESMFSQSANSSKVALVALCRFLHSQKVKWIDCQIESQHLMSLGAINIDRHEFLERIKKHLVSPIELDWQQFQKN